MGGRTKPWKIRGDNVVLRSQFRPQLLKVAMISGATLQQDDYRRFRIVLRLVFCVCESNLAVRGSIVLKLSYRKKRNVRRDCFLGGSPTLEIGENEQADVDKKDSPLPGSNLLENS